MRGGSVRRSRATDGGLVAQGDQEFVNQETPRRPQGKDQRGLKTKINQKGTGFYVL
jgi:hypothetical protein